MEKQLAEIFSVDGPLARFLGERYEWRPQQLEMALSVAKSLAQGRSAVIEAGTGTGKSLAYLIPSILWAREHREKIAIATHTIALQEQLLTKDIPLIQDALGLPVKATLVKGWSNYACKFRLQRLMEKAQELLEPGEAPAVAAILQMTVQNGIGSKSELPFEPPAAVWEKLCAESDTCLRQRCPFYDNCFFFEARKGALAADVLLVNHHLFFADVAVRREVGLDQDVAVLPRVRHVIFDEAHHIEDVATEYFGVGLSYVAFARLIGRIYRRTQPDRLGGLAGLLRKYLAESNPGGDEAASQVLIALDLELVPAALKLEELAARFFGELSDLIASKGRKDGSELHWRITHADLGEGGAWETQLATGLDKLLAALQHVGKAAQRVRTRLDASVTADEADQGGELPALTTELQSVQQRASGLADTLRMFQQGPDEARVLWVGRSHSRQAALHMAPLQIVGEFQAGVLEPLDGVIFTSATMGVAGSFDFFRERLGLPQGSETLTAMIESPFDYRRQAMVGLPNDIPAPDSPQFAGELSRFLTTLLIETRGRAFLLFTSYALLNQVHDLISPRLRAEGLTVFKQSEAPRGRLLDLFRRSANPVLFGTDSFWEGVDVQGEALSCVVITKLPFRVPTDPVISARVERLTAEGLNAFLQYIVPQAVLKFRQGFGRLIRTQQDRGAVILCDRRVLDRGYGAAFLSSLPDTHLAIEPATVLVERVASWLADGHKPI